jgi:hypothetical protein
VRLTSKINYKFHSRCKKDGNNSNFSPRSSVEVKHEWSYSYFPPIHLHGVDMGFVFYSTNLCVPSYGNDEDGDMMTRIMMIILEENEMLQCCNEHSTVIVN